MKIEILFPEICNLYGELFNMELIRKSCSDAEFIETNLNDEPLFASEELKKRYSDYGFALLTKDDFKAVIEAYRQKIINWLQSLLNPEDDPIIPSELSKEERKRLTIEHEIQDKIDSWSGKYFGISPIDLDESRERITGDWSYEYAIFELVRLYKIFDWENDDLVLVGW